MAYEASKEIQDNIIEIIQKTFDDGSLDPEKHHRYHQRLFEAITAGDVKASEKCMSDHLEASVMGYRSKQKR